MQKKKQPKKSTFRIFCFILGVIIISYPIVSNCIYKFTQTTAITHYQEEIINLDNDEKENIENDLKKYNEDIFENSTSTIDLSKKQKMLGYINIPKIDVNLIIYEGTDKNVLEKGIRTS